MLRSILLTFALMAVPVTSHAAIVQMNFTGTISTQGNFLDPTGGFSPGQAISGFWVIDTGSIDGDADPLRGLYSFSGSPAFRIVIGGSVFESTTNQVQILDDYTLLIGTVDAYDVFSPAFGATSNIAGLSGITLQLTFRDTQAPLDAITGDTLPAGAPIPGAFDQVGQVQGQILGTLGTEPLFMNLAIDSVAATAVPLPAAAWLLLGGLAMAGARGRWRRVSDP